MAAEAFKAAREFLFTHRTDYATAHAEFRWPQLEHFNYALDWFDAELAHGKQAGQLALKIVGDGAATRTFAELSAASNQIANGLRALGVKRGERILLMLGNVVPLWEVMLAAMKLGAVVIPATTLLSAYDLKDRFERGHVRHLVANAADAPKFDGLDPTVTRIAVGDAPAGWHSYDALRSGPTTFSPDAPTRATDPLLLYFTSGTTSRPKLVEHSHQSYPAGHLITMYWIGLQPGDMHLNISSPGWAKHAYSCFFAPWNAGATVFIANQPRFNARGMLAAITENNVTTICAPPTVWRMFVQEDMTQYKTALREVLSAGEPCNPEIIEHVRKVWDLTVREGYGQTETTLQIGCFPGQTVKPGSMGHEAPG
ncbi:MAG TPA: AMP-binding protein, partial [Acetobacteraceae bacterium]|nr:AMP-binding protein [Acetobacteraceae bacterium]